MYPIELFVFMAAVDIGLTVFAVTNKNTDYYKDLIALGLATFITVFLSQSIISGSVFVYSGDSSGITMSYIQDAGLMWIGYLLAGCQGFILLLEGVETVQDYFAQKNMKRLIG